MNKFDVTAVGETMLRCSVPAGERLAKLRRLDIHVGGAESNALASLSALGRRCGWVSALPDNDLGRFVLREMAAAKIDTSAVLSGQDRLGSYYVEFAAAPRPINVIYDRAHSAVSRLTPAQIDWEYLLNTTVLLLTGITPALSQGCYDIVLEACRRAKEKQVQVCFDVNYRHKLWSPQTAREQLTTILPMVDILICGEGDMETVFGVSGSTQHLLNAMNKLSGARHVILTQSSRGSSTLLDGEVVTIEAEPAEIVDRIGAGDAYTAGVIDGFLDGDIIAGMKRGSVLSALALTQHGDMVTTTRSEVISLLKSDWGGISR